MSSWRKPYTAKRLQRILSLLYMMGEQAAAAAAGFYFFHLGIFSKYALYNGMESACL